MNRTVLSFCGLCLCLATVVAEDPPGGKGGSFPKNHWLHGVDFANFREEAVRRGVELPERAADLDAHLEVKFRQIFAKHVERRFLLARPSPKWVMQRTLQALEVHRRLEEKLVEGQRVLDGGDRREIRRYVKEVKGLANDLKRLFETRFREGPKAGHTVLLETVESSDVRQVFGEFLFKFNLLNDLLAERLNSFFFLDERNVVSVSELERPSVTILCRALRRMCEQSIKRIGLP